MDLRDTSSSQTLNFIYFIPIPSNSLGLLFTKDVYQKEVFADDGKKLGKAVNLLMNFGSSLEPQLDIVIFPNLIMKLVRNNSGMVTGSLTGQAVSHLKQFIPGIEAADVVMDQIGGWLSTRTGSQVQKTVTVIQESFYLVPIHFVTSVRNDSIVLSTTHTDCRRWFLNTAPVPEVQLALLSDKTPLGKDRPISSSLNVGSIENKVITDPSGRMLFCIDIEFEVFPAQANAIVLTDRGIEGVGRLVPFNEIRYEDDRLVIRNNFESYSSTTL